MTDIGEGSITIYISAHGFEFFENPLTSDQKQNVFLLSLAGRPGSCTTIGYCYDNVPTSERQLHMIGKFYNKYLQPPVSQKQILYNEELTKKIYEMYEEAFDNCIEKLPSFSRTSPETNRYYQLQPNKGEDKDLDPTYGITVLASTNEADNDYTLTGLLKKGERNPYGRRSNLNVNKDALRHWLSRSNFTNDIKNLIKKDLSQKFMTLQNVILFFKSMGFKNILIWDTSCRAGEFTGRPSSFRILSKKEELPQPPDTPFKVTRALSIGPPETLTMHRDTESLTDTAEEEEECDERTGICGRVQKMAEECYNGVCRKIKTAGTKRRRQTKKTRKNKKTKKIKKSKKNKTQGK